MAWVGARSLIGWTLGGLAVGLALGIIGHATGSPALGAIAAGLRPFGELWTAALQLTALPLVIAHTLAAIVSAKGAESLGSLGSKAVILFVVMLVAAALFTLLATPPLIANYQVDAAALANFAASTPVPEAARTAAAGSTGSLTDLITDLVPRNLFQAAADGQILPLLLFTLVFAAAVRRLPAGQREPLTRAFEGLAAAMMQCIRWLLLATPVGVLILAFVLAQGAGVQAAGMMGVFVVIQCGLMLAFTALLYPVTAFLGQARVVDFARAVAPAQFVALGTRSSIAALPAMIEGARTRLKLPPSATGFTLPFCVSLFKVNRTVSSPMKLLFVAHLYGIPLSASTIVAFVVTIMLMSFGTVGVSSGGSAFRTLPAYMAAGLPLEPIVILEAVEAIPDMFKTMLNVTADMSVATLLSRSSRATPSVGVVPEGPAPDHAA